MTDYGLRSQASESTANASRSHSLEFSHDPGHDELACFVDPKGLAAWLRVVDTPRELRVEPGAISHIFVAICISPALAGLAWVWRRKFAAGFRDPWEILELATCVLAVIAFLNRRFQALGTFCVVDLVNSQLELPRLGVSLSRREIVRFVEFRGWFGDIEKQRARELSVIAKNDQGQFSRYQVVIDNGWYVTRVGQRLAEFFGVDLTILKK